MGEYGHYFLGSIIISDKDGQKFIIDGQQRLTTLTLLLIYLHHQLEDDEQKARSLTSSSPRSSASGRSISTSLSARRAWKRSTKARSSRP